MSTHTAPLSSRGASHNFPLSGPLSVGDLLDRAFRLYRARFLIFLLTAAVFLVPLAVISGLLTGRFISDYFQAFELLTSEATRPGDLFSFLFISYDKFLGVILLYILLTMAANSFVDLALTTQCIESLHNRSLTFEGGIRQGLRRFWPYVGMTIAKWAAIVAATMAVMIPILVSFALLFGGALAGLTLGELGEEAGIISVIGLGVLLICGYALLFTLILAPITYLSARWFVAPAALIAEGLGPLDSLRRSWRLSQGHILRVVGYVVLLYVIMALVLSFPTALFQQIVFVLLPTSALGLATSISTVISSLLSVIGIPFYIGALVLVYYDLRIRGESYDLELRVADLEKQIAQGDKFDVSTPHLPRIVRTSDSEAALSRSDVELRS